MLEVIFHACANTVPFVDALYGWPTVVGGWVAPLVHSALIGLLFAFVVSRRLVGEQTTTVVGSVAPGAVYAAGVCLVTGGVMLQIAVNALGTLTFPEPLLPVPGLLGDPLVVISLGVAHVGYGVLLGAT